LQNVPGVFFTIDQDSVGTRCVFQHMVIAHRDNHRMQIADAGVIQGNVITRKTTNRKAGLVEKIMSLDHTIETDD
jgi:hypothetical protein